MWPEILKIIGIVLLCVCLLLAAAAACILILLRIRLGDGFKQYKDLLTLQKTEKLPPLENVTKQELEILYINRLGKEQKGKMILYLPDEVKKPVPLVYVPHYPLAENSKELREYIGNGWAAASPIQPAKDYSSRLTDDDLVFNNAALYTLRGMQEVDPQRIALAGGSAGGYTALMLSALQMGICASVATAPITNVYFNFYQYFRSAKRRNAPFFLALMRDSYLGILDNFNGSEDIARWEALSPVALTDCYTSPLTMTHVTSDILVPIDQITREFTYAEEGKSMPKNFSTRMDRNNPGVLGQSFCERLPGDEVCVNYFSSVEGKQSKVYPIRDDQRFYINIYDNGPTQRYSSHSSSLAVEEGKPDDDVSDAGEKKEPGAWESTSFIACMFDHTLAETEVLTKGKFRLLLERYEGNSPQLPAHEGVNDEIYGSLEIYRREIIQEFRQYVKNNSVEKLDAVADSALNEDEEENLIRVWEELRRKVTE